MTGTFDPTTHTYTIDGRVVPSVTQIVRRCVPYREPPGQTPEEAEWVRERGRMVHRYCDCVVRGTLDWGSVDPRIEGYVRAAAAWVALHPLDAPEIEVPLYDRAGQYAGTPDLTTWRMILEWKCYDDPAGEIQMGGYACLAQMKTGECIAVELKENGQYRETIYATRRCRGLWQAALSLYQWYESYGMNKKGDDK